MPITVTPKMAEVYQALKSNQGWRSTDFIGKSLGHWQSSAVLQPLNQVFKSGMAEREKFGKGYCWCLVSNAKVT